MPNESAIEGLKSPSSPRIEIDWAAYEQLSDADKAALDAAMAQFTDAIKLNPLEGYVPHGKQKLFHGATAKRRMFKGGNRSGKSTGGVVDDLIQCLDEKDVPEHLRPYKRWEPPFKCRVITPDLSFTMDAVLDKFREMVPQHTLSGGVWEKSFDKTRRILRFKNGSIVDFMSTEQDPNKFGGVDRHRIHYDEEPCGPNSQKIYTESKGRLADYDGDEIWTMTPLFGMSWVYDEIWQARKEKGIFVVSVDIDDNPHLSQAGKEAFLADLTDEERRMRKSGEFVSLSGLFYPEFTEALHTIPSPPPEDVKDWDVVVGIDPGIRTGVLWVGFDGDNKAIVFDELYPKDEVPEDIAAAIKQKNERWGVSPSYVIDPASRMRSGPNQEQYSTEYSRHGIHCAEGQNHRGSGITEMKRRLQKGLIFISRDCQNFIWEMGRYQKKPDAADEFEALKKDDHLCDAARYAVMARTWRIPNISTPRSNFNPSPKFEPPWRGPTSTDNPPLGVFS